MNAARFLPAAAAIAALAAGCATTGADAPADATTSATVAAAPAAQAAQAAEAARAAISSAVGGSIADVIAAAGDSRMEFFDVDGNALDALPKDAPGSVSVHFADGSGQQNYAFGADGVILAHKISAGEDYSNGVWADVK